MSFQRFRLPQWLGITRILASNSPCERLKVGTIIILDNRIISSGWNKPIGSIKSCEIDGVTGSHVAHAEEVALMQLATCGPSPVDAVMVSNFSPCEYCARLILQSGIKALYYGTEFRDTKGINFLKSAGVVVEKISGSVHPSN